MQHLELTFAANPTAPATARHGLRDWLREQGCGDDATDTAVLLVSELVTNAVVYATGAKVYLTAEAGTVMHVAVRDGSSVIPRQPAQASHTTETGGRGLFLVQELSLGWGWEPLCDGKRAWFELPCRSVSACCPSGLSV